MKSIYSIDIAQNDEVDVVTTPWDVAADVQLQAHYLRNALKRSKDQPVCVGLTSLGPKEGVSWVASMLACSFADAGEKTILVDMNRRHPTQLEAFNCHRQGVLDNLVPGLRCSKSTMKGLWIGVPDAALWSMNSQPRDMNIIFDFDCMSRSADINANRLKLDGVVFVVESQRQRREAVAHALERLQMSGVHVLGVVVNRKRHYLPETIYRLL